MPILPKWNLFLSPLFITSLLQIFSPANMQAMQLPDKITGLGEAKPPLGKPAVISARPAMKPPVSGGVTSPPSGMPPDMLSKIPEEHREKAVERWNSMSDEEKQKALQSMHER